MCQGFAEPVEPAAFPTLTITPTPWQPEERLSPRLALRLPTSTQRARETDPQPPLHDQRGLECAAASMWRPSRFLVLLAVLVTLQGQGSAFEVRVTTAVCRMQHSAFKICACMLRTVCYVAHALSAPKACRVCGLIVCSAGSQSQPTQHRLNLPQCWTCR